MALKKNKSELPSEVQELIQSAQVEDTRQQTKMLHSAVSQLGNAKKSLKELNQARLKLHSQWSKFLEESLTRWNGYADNFQEQDAELQQRIEEAKQSVLSSKENFKECQAATGVTTEDKDAIEVSDDDDAIAHPNRVGEAMKRMQENLEKMKDQMEVELQTAKRKRTEEDKDVKVGEGGNGTSQPFQQAGKWVHQLSFVRAKLARHGFMKLSCTP